MSLTETFNLPVAYKKWYVDRVSKELKKGQNEGESQSRAPDANTPALRSLLGRQRDQVPARHRRFT